MPTVPVAVVALVITGVTAGPVEVLRGFGAAVEKSTEFWLVSVAPSPARKSAVELEWAGAAALPSKALAVP